jgi:hypothetical protein
VSISGTRIQIYNGETVIQQNSFNLDADTLEILILDSSGKWTPILQVLEKGLPSVVLKSIIMVPLNPMSSIPSTSLAMMTPDPQSPALSVHLAEMKESTANTEWGPDAPNQQMKAISKWNTSLTD